jgi:hypothetical protein
MADLPSRTKRPRGEFWMFLDCSDNRRNSFAEERHILELISLGAPLPGILNQLCTAIDVRIGNVVSLVLLADVEEKYLGSISQSAVQVGLNVFSSTPILSRDKTLLGKFEIYGCDPRRPTPQEAQLIERITHLAAIALQRHVDEDEDFARSSRRSKTGIGGASEGPRFIN